MKKRILSLLLCAVLCVTLLPTAAFAEETAVEPTVSGVTEVPSAPEAPVTPATPETPVEPELPEPPADPAMTAVQALIDALPTLDTVTAGDYDAVQDAYDAYDSLTDAQQAQVTGAEVFEALFGWFNAQTELADDKHKHCICGGNCKGMTGHTCDENIEWTAWTDSEAAKQNDYGYGEWTADNCLPQNRGYYYLTKDVRLSNTWQLYSWFSWAKKDIVLCLNGHKIIINSYRYGNDQPATIEVGQNATLTLTDCQDAGEVTHGTTGYGNQSRPIKGVGVSVDSSATFNMYGGKITGNKAHEGGGVLVNAGAFTMNGGKITGNTATGNYGGGGVGVAADSAVKISGAAQITGNKKNDTTNNIYLNCYGCATQLITVDKLTGDASIGVSTSGTPTESKPVVFTASKEGIESDKTFFFSDAGYEIGVSANNELQLQVGRTACDTGKHTKPNAGGKCDNCGETVVAKVTYNNSEGLHEEYYTEEELAAAFSKARQYADTAGKVTMLADATYPTGETTCNLPKTLDLGTYTLTFPDDMTVSVSSHTTLEGTGTLIASGLTVAGTSSSLSSLTVGSALTVNSPVTVNSNGTLTVTAGTFSKAVTVDSGALTVSDGTFSGAVTVNGGSAAISYGTFNGNVLVKGGTVNISAGSFKGGVNVEANGIVNISGGTFTDKAVVRSGGTLKLSGGTYAKVDAAETNADGVGGLLADTTYGYRQMIDGKVTWYDHECTESELAIVTVKKLPIQSVTAGADQTVTTTQTPAVLTATPTLGDGYSNALNYPVTYQWQEWKNGDWKDIAGAGASTYAFSTAILVPGTYRFRCGVTVDNYTRYSNEVTVTVNKASFTAAVNMSDYTYGDTPSTPGVTSYPGNGAVTYYYSTSAVITGGTKWENITGTTLNAGDYYMYAVIDASGSYEGCTTAVKKFTVKKADLSSTDYTAPKANDLTYNGSEQALVTAGTGTDITFQYKLEDGTWSDDIPTGTNANTYKVYWKATPSNSNYNPLAPTEPITVTIKQKEITVTGATADNKTYDGNTTAKVTGVTFDGLGTGKTLTISTDYTASGAFADATAGNDKTVNVTVTLKNSNYIFADSKTEATTTATANIAKATAPVADAGSLTVYNNYAKTYSFDFSALLPTGKTYGTIAYSAPTVNFTVADYYNTASAATVNSTTGVLSLPIQKVDSNTEGSVGTVTVVVTTTNYADITLTLNVCAANKTAKPLKVTMEGWTYGETGNEPDYGTLPTGVNPADVKITYQQGETQLSGKPSNAGNYTVTVFYETDTETFTGTANFTISKAAPSVTAPAANTLTYNGSEQALVTAAANVPTGCKVYYRLGENGTWGETVPTEKNADAYQVYWYVKGGANYADDGSENSPKGPVSVTISKKTVTATVTVASKTYDGEDTATVTAQVAASDIASGDSITIAGLTGTFDTADVGGNKTVTVNAENVVISGAGSANYDVNIPSKASGTITRAKLTGVAAPKAKDLTYNGDEQALVTADTGTDITFQYKLEGGAWSNDIPKGTDANTYKVYWKATRLKAGSTDSNYEPFVAETPVTVTIKKATASFSTQPQGNTGLTYTGSEQALMNTPGVSTSGVVEYSTDSGKTWHTWTKDGLLVGKDAEDYTLKFRPGASANYKVGTEVSVTVSIAPLDLASLQNSDINCTSDKSPTYNGQEHTLAIKITYNGSTLDEGTDYTLSDHKKTNVDSYTAKISAVEGGNFTGSCGLSWEIKPAKLTIANFTIDSKTYDGNTTANVTGVTFIGLVNNETLILGTDYTATAAFADAAAGESKDITLTVTMKNTEKAKNYDLAPVTFVAKRPIAKAAPGVTAPAAKTDLIFNGKSQSLIHAGAAVHGTMKYSFDQNSWTADSTDITGAEAGTYVVYYKVFGDANYSDTAVGQVEVTIGQRVSSDNDSDPSYTITVKDAQNGEVTSSRRTAPEGETITITVDPSKGFTMKDLTVLDRNGKKIKLTEKGGGKFTFKMPASRVTVTATFAGGTVEQPFVDVPSGAYYEDAVQWAKENGITGGVDATHFNPNAICTRAQAVTFLWRAAGKPAPASAELPFTDVLPGSYYEQAVLWAVENGITKGTTDTTFSPNQTCTRAQIVTFLFRYAAVQGMNTMTMQELVSGCGDAAQVPGYALSAFNWALYSGVVQGNGGNIQPNNGCTRAQIVTFLYRASVGV